MTARPDKILIDSGPSGAGWSSLESMTTCPQRYAYRHILFPDGLCNRDALVRGSIGHVGLAHLYARVKALQDGTDPEAFYTPDEAMQLVAPKWGEVGMRYLDLCREGVEAYSRFYAGDAASLRVVGVEHLVETTVPTRYGPRRFTARIDLSVSDQTGRVRVVDHKWVSDSSESKMQWRYKLSGQFLGLNCFGRMLYGDRFAGVWVNVVGVSGEFSFKRVPIDPAWNAIRRFPRILADAFERIEELRASGRDPWDWPKAVSERTCITPYGRCEGYDLCANGEDSLVALGNRSVPASAVGGQISMAAWASTMRRAEGETK